GGRDDDHFSVTLGPITDANVSVKASLGDGIDTFQGQIHGDVSGSASVSFTIDGGRDQDQVAVTLGAVTDASVSVKAALGDGDDTFHGQVTGDLNGRANVSFDVDGGKGIDTIDVTANHDAVNHDGIDIDTKATLNINLKGGADDDTLTFAYDGI